MLVPMKTIVDEAYKGGYGVPALPAHNELLIRGAVEAAVETNSPLIFLVGNFNDGLFNRKMIEHFANQVDIPIATCLDHSPSFNDCVMGIRTGVTCIMADRSMKSYEENVAEVKALADIAHAAGVSIEAELGHVGQGDNYSVDGVSMLTDPDEAKRFIDETGVDCLAVAVGTAHGQYKGTPHIDFERLQAINEKCGIPLVLHGGSGTGDENISKACTMGIAKVNVVTDVLQNAVKHVLNSEVDFTEGNNGFRLCPTIQAAAKEMAIHMFDVCGCTGKAVPTGLPGLWKPAPRADRPSAI